MSDGYEARAARLYWDVLVVLAESSAHLAVLHERCRSAGVSPAGVRLRPSVLRRVESPIYGPRGVEDVASMVDGC